MTPATAKARDTSELEDLGRATLQIVHDLKNQLNGIKLYATFLRKRWEGREGSLEEREILAKLIAGLDRAAAEMSALVRYSRPVELRRQRTNLKTIVLEAAPSSICEPANESLYGEFDPQALSEAFRSLTEHAVSRVSGRDLNQLAIRLNRSDSTPEATVEWHAAAKFQDHGQSGLANNYASVHAALAAKIIEAHGGRVEFGVEVIRAWLPLSD